MTKTLTIKTLQTKQIDTKFGKKNVMNISFYEKDRFWADVWCADWNKNWAVNKEVEIEDSQWKKREYPKKDGSIGTAWNIIAPPPISREEFDALVERVKKLEIGSGALTKKEISIDDIGVEEGPETPTEAQISPNIEEDGEEDDIINSIPF